MFRPIPITHFPDRSDAPKYAGAISVSYLGESECLQWSLTATILLLGSSGF